MQIKLRKRPEDHHKVGFFYMDDNNNVLVQDDDSLCVTHEIRLSYIENHIACEFTIEDLISALKQCRLNKSKISYSFNFESAIKLSETFVELYSDDKMTEGIEEEVLHIAEFVNFTITTLKDGNFDKEKQFKLSINFEKFNRNEPCHCGSGKKYKKCCKK